MLNPPDRTPATPVHVWMTGLMSGAIFRTRVTFRKIKFLLDSVLDAVAHQVRDGEFGFVRLDRSKACLGGRMRGNKQLTAILVRNRGNLECPDTSGLIDNLLFVHTRQGSQNR